MHVSLGSKKIRRFAPFDLFFPQL